MAEFSTAVRLIAQSAEVQQLRLESAALARLPQDARRAAMFNWDQSYAGAAVWYDPRMCGTNPPTRIAAAGGSCNNSSAWCLAAGFLDVKTACTPTSLTNVLFQEERYTWAQRRLQALLSARPQAKSEFASDNAAWVMELQRTIALARWASNVNAAYAEPYGDRTKALIATIKGDATGPARAGQQKIVDDDNFYAQGSKNRYVLMLWTPADLNITYERSQMVRAQVPTSIAAFAPVPTFHMGTTTDLSMGPAQSDAHPAWPWRATDNQSPGSDTYAAMTKWFEKSGVAGGYWWNDSQNLVKYRTRSCGTQASGQGCTKEARTAFWYGTGRAIIELTVAMAQDVIATSFGVVVSNAVKKFFEAYAKLPAEYRTVEPGEVKAMVDALNTAVAASASTGLSIAAGIATAAAAIAAGAAATGPGAIVGVVLAAVVAVAAALVAILGAAGGLAMGAGDLEKFCPAMPFVRMMTATGTSGVCDFNVSAFREAPAVEAALVRTNTVKVVAEAGVPADRWHGMIEAVQNGTPLADLIGPPAAPSNAKRNALLFAAAAALVGGVYWVRR